MDTFAQFEHDMSKMERRKQIEIETCLNCTKKRCNMDLNRTCSILINARKKARRHNEH